MLTGSTGKGYPALGGPEPSRDSLSSRLGSLGRSWHSSCHEIGREDTHMLYYALMFLIVGLVAGALGLFGVAAVAGQIAWILFLVGVVILVVHLVTDRGTRA